MVYLENWEKIGVFPVHSGKTLWKRINERNRSQLDTCQRWQRFTGGHVVKALIHALCSEEKQAGVNLFLRIKKQYLIDVRIHSAL